MGLPPRTARADARKRACSENWEQKAVHKPLHFSAPDTTPLLEDEAAEPGEEDTRAADVLDLTAKLGADGTLRWDVPAGDWQVLRFGCTIGDHSHVSTCSDGWEGYRARRARRRRVPALLGRRGRAAHRRRRAAGRQDAEVPAHRQLGGRAAQLDADAARGVPQAPRLRPAALCCRCWPGRIVDSRAASNRFLHDFRKTIGDLAIDNHYRLFRDGAHRHGLLIHPESGGPHAVPIDAQRCLGFDDVPMSEFWAWSWRHRVGDENRFFVKQPASAAHTYGRRLVAAEGFTTIGPHWQETLWDNLKPAFDKACCEGLNLLVWHAFVCSPAEQGMPGQPVLRRHALQSERHLVGEVRRRSSPTSTAASSCSSRACSWPTPATTTATTCRTSPSSSAPIRPACCPATTTTSITEEALLDADVACSDGRIVLPDGMSYRVLVLPRPHGHLAAGAAQGAGTGRRRRDGRRAEADRGHRAVPDGRRATPRCASWPTRCGTAAASIAGKTAREVLLAAGVKPDFEFAGGDDEDRRWTIIHRRDGDAEIYFVANRGPRAERVRCTFRVAGKAPELWDAVTGQHSPLAASIARRTAAP